MAKLSKDYNLAVLYPDIAKEWHPTKNGGLKPSEIAPYSNKKVWWICNKGHEWRQAIGHRSEGRKCPYCFGHGRPLK